MYGANADGLFDREIASLTTRSLAELDFSREGEIGKTLIRPSASESKLCLYTAMSAGLVGSTVIPSYSTVVGSDLLRM